MMREMEKQPLASTCHQLTKIRLAKVQEVIRVEQLEVTSHKDSQVQIPKISRSICSSQAQTNSLTPQTSILLQVNTIKHLQAWANKAFHSTAVLDHSLAEDSKLLKFIS